MGIERLDAQHAEIAALVNAVQTEVNRHAWSDTSRRPDPEGPCCKRVRRLLERLSALTEAHFAEEERLMERCNYPQLAGHRLEHRLMLADFKGLFRAICSGRACLRLDDLIALEGWFIGHLASDDRALAQHLRQQGRQLLPVYALDYALNFALDYKGENPAAQPLASCLLEAG
jgi:hemerythrin-like metal-binding protein